MSIYKPTGIKLRFTLPTPRDSLVGATLRMTIKKTEDDAEPVLVLDTNDGIEITDAKRGNFDVYLSPAAKAGLGFGQFTFDVVRTDKDAAAPIASGGFEIKGHAS